MILSERDILYDFIKFHNINEQLLIDELMEYSSISYLKKGDYLIKENSYIKLLKIVIKGRVRVYQENEDKEILIYYLETMETCTLSLSACFGNCKSNVNAVAETDATILNIPVHKVNGWSFEYKSWHNFTIDTFRHSYSELIFNYSKLAFDPLRERLLDYLIKNSDQNIVQLSHAQLARELGTTREVVSRLLKKIELEKKIVLGQKTIKILT
ncbi:Crp/Fnr family transcriptional regulator [Flagellimonas hymeniacidonis]|uniref:Crp/Fnr family transcriptional regulator n=1 Tax=Flagellimonas hymeniacidonis TaxID=2603628 RepID=A0A5C8V245_9FLAO|nr:Crp/Fnr family transcriptional regulator [Flagellimonas hymeniacidonis]TXN34975.1 Crp/Fnr family transcriptional regulator [Flagellimonas hymeniacidonis]